jgi:CRP-like cAMP-binding protein
MAGLAKQRRSVPSTSPEYLESLRRVSHPPLGAARALAGHCNGLAFEADRRIIPGVRRHRRGTGDWEISLRRLNRWEASLGIADNNRIHPLVTKLETITKLTPEERTAVLALPLTVKTVPADNDIVREGDRPAECCLVLDGFLCRYKLLPDGRRQILSFHIAGDIPDLQSLHLEVMDHSLSTLVPSTVGFIPHRAIHDLHDRHSRLAKLFWRETLIDAAIFREWMASIGRRTAVERAARTLCEVLVRMRAVGIATDHHCELPLTQTELADALGILAVHVNRVLQELRANGLIVLSGGSLTVQDWTGLKELAGFDPSYLHLSPDVERDATA